MPLTLPNPCAQSSVRHVQKLSTQRGAGPQQALWLLREFGADAWGRPRTMRAIHSVIGETFGVSDRTARRWCDGELATIRHLEEMRQRWGLSFIIHLFEGCTPSPQQQDAIWALRQLADGTPVLVRGREARPVDDAPDPLCRPIPSGVDGIAEAARIFAELVAAEHRRLRFAFFRRLAGHLRLGRA